VYDQLLYIFKVHQITASGKKIQYFFLAMTGSKMPLRIHQNKPFQAIKNHFFQRMGLPDLFW